MYLRLNLFGIIGIFINTQLGVCLGKISILLAPLLSEGAHLLFNDVDLPFVTVSEIQTVYDRVKI